jgi:beta-N-acetylhexosaminidase
MEKSPISSFTCREFLRWGGSSIAVLALLPAQRRPDGSAGKPPGADLDAKIGQLILAGFRGYALAEKNPIVADLADRSLGGVVLFDYDVATHKWTRNVKAPEQLAALDESFQAATSFPPLLISVDQEGGKINRLKPAYGFPPS